MMASIVAISIGFAAGIAGTACAGVGIGVGVCARAVRLVVSASANNEKRYKVNRLIVYLRSCCVEGQTLAWVCVEWQRYFQCVHEFVGSMRFSIVVACHSHPVSTGWSNEDN